MLQAIKEGRKRFLFLGQDIRLIPSCGIYVTMNPGYAGKGDDVTVASWKLANL